MLLRRALLLITTLLSLTAASDESPRPPFPPIPAFGLLHTESFDEPYGFPSVVPMDRTVWTESWSGWALQRQGELVAPWVVPMITTNGVRVDPQCGAVRFWYRPEFASGVGAGRMARLLTLATASGQNELVWWSLVVSPDGRSVELVCETEHGLLPCLSATVNWAADSWQLLTLGYSPTNSVLFVNDEPVAWGVGVATVPEQFQAFTSLIVGSDATGAEPAAGQIDELATFSGQKRFMRLRGLEFGLSAQWDVVDYFSWMQVYAALGPVSAEEQAAVAELRAKRKAELAASGEKSGGGGMEMRLLVGGTSECITNVPVYLTNIVSYLDTNAGWTVLFDIQGGTNGVFWDIFSTTNLSGSHITNSQWFWLERGPSCYTYQYNNQPEARAFFVLGATNDSDSGGLPNAYEQLVTHGDTGNPGDDRLVPLISIYVMDSVAAEQGNTTNTAHFVVSRLGGYLLQPLTIGCVLSGTATNGVDYSLSPVTATATNVLVTIPAGQTSVELTLTPINDAIAEGTETATLTLTTNVQSSEVNLAHSSATAWILEQYVRVYTLNQDFNLGVLAGLAAVSNQLQFQTNLPAQFPFINVACSARGTVARINTTNGQVIGEYLTAPTNIVSDPSRTTVDQFGNVWVANRADNLPMDGVTNGSITRIGLVLGTRYSKTNGVYFPDSNGQYINVTNALYNTCVDRDGDGYIRTSRGLADILPWTNQRDGLTDADTRGGVSTAEDEAIREYVRVASTGTRTIAVDKFNNIWVGGYGGNRIHLKVNGLTGSPVPDSAFAPDAGGYGGVIDSFGRLWSSPGRLTGRAVLRLTPSVQLPPNTNEWQRLLTGDSSVDTEFYGIAVDPVHPYIWQTTYSTAPSVVFRWHPDGTPATNQNGTLQTFAHGAELAQGLAVDAVGHAWIAHGPDANTIGHLDHNGVWLSNVVLRLAGLRAEYFANTNLAGVPVLVRADGPIDFNWGAGSPDPIVPTNYFSAKWTGGVLALVADNHEFFVSADAGAGFRLTVNGTMIINNWDNPDPNPVELSGSRFLSAPALNDLVLEYKESTGDARVRLSWMEPGTTNKVVIPRERLQGTDLGGHPTGVSVDSFGKIWAANQGTSDAMRIDPNAGEMIVTNGVTNFVGEVDLVVKLGDGAIGPFNPHLPPYDVAAGPYNYSDMTGFNNRVVNPALQPLKGYWTVIDDCGMTNEIWERVAWSNNLPIAGCAMEVFVRAGNNRQMLANELFVSASNNVPLANVIGRYIEVRIGLTRDVASKQPVLYDLTLFSASSGFVGDLFLEDAWADEAETTWFWVDLAGPEPLTYQWQVLYPWTNEWAMLTGETNWYLEWPNADQWENGSLATVAVSNAAGQVLQLGPAQLAVYFNSIHIPGSPTNSWGTANRYPATINVRGEPTSGLSRVEVTLQNLSHYYPADLDILLVSPSGTKIMLMSDAGSSFAVTNATLVFHPEWQGYPYPPESAAIPSDQTSEYTPRNYGDQESQLPNAPAGPYTGLMNDLPSTDSNPNGVWKLYIYDDKSGQTGALEKSWSIEFHYAP